MHHAIDLQETLPPVTCLGYLRNVKKAKPMEQQDSNEPVKAVSASGSHAPVPTASPVNPAAKLTSAPAVSYLRGFNANQPT